MIDRLSTTYACSSVSVICVLNSLGIQFAATFVLSFSVPGFDRFSFVFKIGGAYTYTACHANALPCPWLRCVFSPFRTVGACNHAHQMHVSGFVLFCDLHVVHSFCTQHWELGTVIDIPVGYEVLPLGVLTARTVSQLCRHCNYDYNGTLTVIKTSLMHEPLCFKLWTSCDIKACRLCWMRSTELEDRWER